MTDLSEARAASAVSNVRTTLTARDRKSYTIIAKEVGKQFPADNVAENFGAWLKALTDEVVFTGEGSDEQARFFGRALWAEIEPRLTRSTQAEQPVLGVEAAAEALDGFEIAVYALDNFATNFAQSPFETHTISTSIVALTHGLQMKITGALNALPAEHPAQTDLADASEFLDDLDAFSAVIDEGMSQRGSGAAMRTFIVGAARSLERAVASCGGFVGSGYLAEPIAVCAADKA